MSFGNGPTPFCVGKSQRQTTQVKVMKITTLLVGLFLSQLSNAQVHPDCSDHYQKFVESIESFTEDDIQTVIKIAVHAASMYENGCWPVLQKPGITCFSKVKAQMDSSSVFSADEGV